MNIWWRWRRKKLLLSLFDGPLSLRDEASSAGAAAFPRERCTVENSYSKNASGPFYVADQECIACGYPHFLAPDLMAWDFDSQGSHSHCYFKKQPDTPEEIEQAIKAVEGCCCGALQYAGTDPEILERLG